MGGMGGAGGAAAGGAGGAGPTIEEVQIPLSLFLQYLCLFCLEMVDPT